GCGDAGLTVGHCRPVEAGEQVCGLAAGAVELVRRVELVLPLGVVEIGEHRRRAGGDALSELAAEARRADRIPAGPRTHAGEPALHVVGDRLRGLIAEPGL